MHEPEPAGWGPFGPPRGEPTRPLAEAVLLFLAFYLPTYLFFGSSPLSIATSAFHLAALAATLPRAALLLYVMATGDGLPAFSIASFRMRDAARGLLCAAGAFAVIIVPGLLFSALGMQNAFLAQASSGTRGGLALAPLLLASSMATGYGEELFFRSYLLRRLGQAGLSPRLAAITSALLFGLGHGYQGVIGFVSGGLLGLFFAWRWLDSGNIHEIAIGHGLFDAAVFALVLYS